MFKLGRSRAVASALNASKFAAPAARFPGVQQRRALSIHEYLSADLLRKYGIGVPKGSVAKSAKEAKEIAEKIGNDDMVIKAQVLAGGRGKGTFDNGLKGGVRVIYSPHEAEMFAEQMIGHKIATKLGFSEQCIEEAKDTIQKLYKIFTEKDSTQIEINPLSETSDHQVLCMDAKFGFDDNADFRQKDVFEWRDTTQEDPDEVRAAESNLNFIKLDGDIGCLVNGAGLAMATMDIIKLNGGQPANFLDVGGGATPAAIREAFELITSDAKVTAIFVNIFGGIVRCDAIATGLIRTVESMNLKIPIIARLQGTNVEKAHQLINDSGLKIFSIDDLQTAAEKSVQLSKVVKMARDIDVGVEFNLGI
ncbi:hypothetical protein ACHAP5_003593 [Fusarium lateritium]